ncbi:YgaP family membrane protein [Arenibacterium sp. CAU 1754]
MTRNEGTIDRVLRVILGLVLLSLVFIGPQTPWGWVGLVPLVTGLIGFCPLYRILGLSTCPLKN